MKTTSFITAIIVALSLLASNNIFAANEEGKTNENKYVYDTQMVDGHINTRTVYKVTKENTLSPYIKHEYNYTNNGKVSEKKTLYWLNEEKEWKEVAIYNFTYSDNTCNIELSVWNGKKNKMLKSRRYIYSTDSENNLTMSISFDWDSKNDGWKETDNETPEMPNPLA